MAFPNLFASIGMALKGVSVLYPPLALLGWPLWLYGVRSHPRAYGMSVVSAVLVLAGSLLLLTGIARLDPETLLSEDNVLLFLGAYLLAQAGGVVFHQVLRLLGFPRLALLWLVSVLLFPLGLPVLYGLRLWLAYWLFTALRSNSRPPTESPARVK